MSRRMICSALASIVLVSLIGMHSARSTEPVQKLESLLGREVSSRPDGDNGRMIDILVDSQGRIRAAVVEFGGFLGIGTRKIAVDWSAFRMENGAVVVDITRDQLRAAKEYKAGNPASAVQASQN